MSEREFREFKNGDGVLTVLPDEYVILHFACCECGRQTSVGIVGPSAPFQLDCNEARRCAECQKKSVVRILREFGCSLPEDRLMQMSLDRLLSLAGTPEGRT
jgi:hypothetical protein